MVIPTARTVRGGRTTGPGDERPEVLSRVRGVLRSPGVPLDARTHQELRSAFAGDAARGGPTGYLLARRSVTADPDQEAERISRSVGECWAQDRGPAEPPGLDFSRVRVHDDGESWASAAALGAQAYTVGEHIVFGPHQYRPNDTAGRALLAHELTHTLQHRNEPTRAVIRRRPATGQETAAFAHMDALITEARSETPPISGPGVANDIDAAKKDVMAQVARVPVGTSDPEALLATLWTLHAWRTTPQTYAKSRAISSPLPVRDPDSGDYKCNRFTADAYAVGAGRGYAEEGRGRRYPTGETSWWDPRSGYPPSANELGSGRAATGNLTNLPLTTTPQPGDVIAFPLPGGIGHSGINLGHNVYISARDSKDHPGRRTQVDDGIQITAIPGSRTAVYRRFRPAGP